SRHRHDAAKVPPRCHWVPAPQEHPRLLLGLASHRRAGVTFFPAPRTGPLASPFSPEPRRNRRFPMRLPSLPRLLASALIAVALTGCGGQDPAAPVRPRDNEPVSPGSAKPAPSAETPRGVPVTPAGDAAPQDGIVKLLDLATDKAPPLS